MENFDSLIRRVVDGSLELDDLIGALLPLIRGEEELPPEIALQLSTTMFEIEAATRSDNLLYSMVNKHGPATMAMSLTGQVLAVNIAAMTKFSLSVGDGIKTLGISPLEFKAFQQRLSEGGAPSLLKFRDSLLVGRYFTEFRCFLIWEVQHRWSAATEQAFQELYGLSDSEANILSHLATGLSSESIAEKRGRSVGTIRQQIKSIMQKTGHRHQNQLVSSAAAASAYTTGYQQLEGRLGSFPLQDKGGLLEINLFRRNGRAVGWRRFGDEKGKPVLFLHGPSFGAGEYTHDRRLASHFNLNVFALERPGYGRSDIPEAGEDSLQCTLEDIRHLMIQEGLDQDVVILAHELALIPALAAIREMPQRFKAVVGASCAPPFLELEQIHDIPPHQGIFILAARHAPWLAHILITLLMIKIRKLGPLSWTDVIFNGIPWDQAAMKNQELKTGIIGSYSFYLNQMGAGFEQDLETMLKSWGGLLQSVSLPVSLLHGTRNTTTAPDYLDIFRNLNPEIHLELVEAAGLTLAVNHPELIYSRVARYCHDMTAG